jgi:hypothetical protein
MVFCHTVAQAVIGRPVTHTHVFKPRSAHVRFVVGKVALVQVSL